MDHHERVAAQPVLKPEARKALDVAIASVPQPEANRPNMPTMDRIHRAVAGISMDRLRLMVADGRVTSQEARMALAQEGLSVEEIDMAVEYTRRVLESYAQNATAGERSLASIGDLLNQKVKKFGAMIAAGNILPTIKKQPKAESVTPAAVASEQKPDGQHLG
jgi:hypothetical protein